MGAARRHAATHLLFIDSGVDEELRDRVELLGAVADHLLVVLSRGNGTP